MNFSLRNIFFCIAILAWFASFIIHILTFAGIEFGKGIWIVGFAIIPGFIALVRRLQKENPQPYDPNRWKSDKRIRIPMSQFFIHAPRWLTIALVVMLVYAVANFVYVLALQEPKHAGLTALDVRLFSGHWMMFHAIVVAGLFPKKGVQ